MSKNLNSEELSIFNNYSQKENRTTAYCGLILKLVYNENPKLFEDIIVSLVNDSSDFSTQFTFQPLFDTQVKKSKSIPDLCISQRSFAIYFEDKNTDWFTPEQINNHIHGMLKNNKSDYMIIFLMTNDFSNVIDDKIKECYNKAQKNSISLVKITFSKYIDTIKSICKNNVNKLIENLIDEFENYLDRNNLLYDWKNRIDIISCRNTQNEITQLLYACPNQNGAYSHKKSKYFGSYIANRKINYVANIDAVVIRELDKYTGKVVYSTKWKNIKESDQKLHDIAETRFQKCEQWRIDEGKQKALQLFLLSDLRPINLIRKKGCVETKTYVTVKAKNLDELITELKNNNDFYCEEL